MAKTLAISGQHYLFTVQAFAQTILALGGDTYEYALRDRTTAQIISDVASGASELGIIVETKQTADELNSAFEAQGLEFIPVATSSAMVALPASHPLSGAKSLTFEHLSDWPYLYFEQEEGTSIAFREEAFSNVQRAKSIACTDRASLSELAVAINGYTITSGILVGITNGGSLVTVPLADGKDITLGYIAPKDAKLSDAATRFVANLEKSLKLYAV